MNITHMHSEKPSATVFGRALRPGEILEEGDQYDNPTLKKWMSIDNKLVGTQVPKSGSQHSSRTFVRPPKLEKPDETDVPKKTPWFSGL